MGAWARRVGAQVEHTGAQAGRASGAHGRATRIRCVDARAGLGCVGRAQAATLGRLGTRIGRRVVRGGLGTSARGSVSRGVDAIGSSVGRSGWSARADTTWN